jgi:hypothetical protein
MKRSELESAKERWCSLFEEILRRHSQSAEWAQWFDYDFENAVLSDDVIPVYGMVNPVARRGIAFCHLDKSNDEPGFSAYTKASLKPEEIEYLTIMCQPNRRNFERAAELLDLWIGSAVSRDMMDKRIDEVLGVSEKEKAKRRQILEAQKKFENRRT